MKKKTGVIICALCLSALVGCMSDKDEPTTEITIETLTVSETEAENTTEADTETTIEAASETTTETEAEEGAANIDEETMKKLMDENLYCNSSIFGLGTLMPAGGSFEPETMGWVVQVDTSLFADWASFEEYVRSVYCEKTADMYLYDYPYEGDAKYINKDGLLYVNMMYDGGRGYYVDWSDYEIEVTDESPERVMFKAKATVEWPADEPVKEPYEAEGAFVFENGKWVLEDSVF